ncbi:MAG: alpha/beta fold hydrolase [Clostridiaceae bacterium]|nr:alpha/beta fold hydrolase [Clostridiaceae bacterium]
MKKRRTRILIGLAALILVLIGAFLLYASDYYRADATAREILKTSPTIRVDGGLVILTPEQAGDTALVFYPGAKVEAVAYLPILEQIAQRCSITCILVTMPFNMAIFDVNAAGRVIGQFPDVTTWYLGGHSMGGAMASAYAADHPEQISGLILLGAYLYGDYPASDSLTIYGSFNTSVANRVGYTENVVVIDGGNHAQFGNYGRQQGDPDATISAQTQQDIAVAAIQAFLAERTGP